MTEQILLLMKDMDFTEPTSEEALTIVENQLNVNFPTQYRKFMLKSNGAEGSIGAHSYLVIWPIDEIVELNEGYGVEEFTPGLIYFGSDGGGMAYAFDSRKSHMPIVEFPFDSIHIEDANLIADTFDEFVKTIYEK